MHPKKGWLALVGAGLMLAAAAAFAAGAGTAPKAAPGPHRDWKNISLLYLSDIKGKIEPCG
jgi:hypothetical protein